MFSCSRILKALERIRQKEIFIAVLAIQTTKNSGKIFKCTTVKTVIYFPLISFCRTYDFEFSRNVFGRLKSFYMRIFWYKCMQYYE